MNQLYITGMCTILMCVNQWTHHKVYRRIVKLLRKKSVQFNLYISLPSTRNLLTSNSRSWRTNFARTIVQINSLSRNQAKKKYELQTSIKYFSIHKLCVCAHLSSLHFVVIPVEYLLKRIALLLFVATSLPLSVSI